VTSLPGQPVLLDADPTRLEQILWNLLSNAIKYAEPGGRISLTARQHHGELVLHVCDTGIGIPAEMLAHVFEMFSHGEPVYHRRQGGLGIGLGLVKSLVELPRRGRQRGRGHQPGASPVDARGTHRAGGP